MTTQLFYKNEPKSIQKRAQERAKETPRAPQRGQEGPKEAPRAPQRCPREPKIASQGSKSFINVNKRRIVVANSDFIE